MTVDDARRLLLSFEGAYEASHHGHPDFRVKKGIFATLWTDKGTCVLRLPMELAEHEAATREGCKLVSRYGGTGWLSIELAQADSEQFMELAEIAWQARL